MGELTKDYPVLCGGCLICWRPRDKEGEIESDKEAVEAFRLTRAEAVALGWDEKQLQEVFGDPREETEN